MVKLLGFAGPAGSGKDTCGRFFIERGWYKDSFAAPMYDGLEAMGFGRPDTQEEKEQPIEGLPSYITWRHAAQTLGTEWGRQQLCSDLWVLLAKKRFVEEAFSWHRIVFTDVRFENEAAMIREMGGIVCHIRGRGLGTGNDNHKSEQRLERKEVDWIIYNDGGLSQLEKALIALLRHCDAAA